MADAKYMVYTTKKDKNIVASKSSWDEALRWAGENGQEGNRVIEVIDNYITRELIDGQLMKKRETKELKCLADNGNLTAGDGVYTYVVPRQYDGWVITNVRARVFAASSSGAVTVQLFNTGIANHDVLSTAVTIDLKDLDSIDAATPHVINATYSTVYEGDVLRVDCDGDGTGVTGLEVDIEFTEPAQRTTWIHLKSLAADAALTVADGIDTWTVPAEYNGWNITDARALLTIASSSEIPTLQFTNTTLGNDIFSTKLTVDANETTSTTAATPHVINSLFSMLTKDEVISIDCDIAGTGTTGLKTLIKLTSPTTSKALVPITVIGSTTSVTVADNKAIYEVPAMYNGWKLNGVYGEITTASSSGIPTFQIFSLSAGVDMLSTKLTVDANEYESTYAANAAVIDTAYNTLHTGDILRFDCDVAGTGTKGLVVQLEFTHDN